MFESISLLDQSCPSYTNICVTSASKNQRHCAQWDEVYVLSRNPDAKTPRVVGQNACHIQLLIVPAQKKADYHSCAPSATDFSICEAQCFETGFKSGQAPSHSLHVRHNASHSQCAKTIVFAHFDSQTVQHSHLQPRFRAEFGRKFRVVITLRSLNTNPCKQNTCKTQ